MNDKVFIDTNVLLYCYSATEPVRQQTAATLFANHNTPIISTQVVSEFCNVLYKKFQIETFMVEKVLLEIESMVLLHTNTVQTIRRATAVKQTYRFSFYDSLIIAAALECGCTMLYSEDMHHGLVIEQSLTICNPFVG